MTMNEKHFNKAMQQLEQRRNKNKATELARHHEVCTKIPEYGELERLLANTSCQLISQILNNRDESQKQLKQLEKNNLDIQKNMQALLNTGGFPENYLEPIYTCSLCKDKGTIDGKWCECFNDLMLKATSEELNSVSRIKLSTFEKFSLEYYSDTTDEKLGVSHRNIMKRNYEYCLNFAKNFSEQTEGILMTGGTGLGKTHLSLAIADSVIKQGYSVIYDSAYNFLRALENEYFGRSNTDTMEALISCDLLILDDLGAEKKDKDLYTSFLYEIINTRMSRGLPMIINSNLGANDIKTRYEDRIWSRIFSYEVLMFVGQDVRRKLRK